MFTQCPQCGSYFRVRDEHLRAAGGNVRCSLCTTTFNAREHLHEKVPETPTDGEPVSREASSEAERDPLTPDMFEHRDDKAAPAPSTPEEPQRPDPDWLLAENETTVGESHPLLWTLGSVFMLLLLGGQMLHAERSYWAEHAWLGPTVSAVYASLGQAIPPPRSLEALEIQRADIAGSAEEPDRLRVTAVVENLSDDDQPLPAVYIRLEDRWGMNMGYGFFPPEEWILRDTLPEHFPARERLPLRVDLRDPSREAVSFHMELCWIEDDGFACLPQRGGAAFVR